MSPRELGFDEVAAAAGPTAFRALGNRAAVRVRRAAVPEQAGPEALAWISAGAADPVRAANASRAGLLVVHESLLARAGELDLSAKCVLGTANPRLLFARIAAALPALRPIPGIHATAVVHPQAKVAPSASIGPFTYVGKAEIGEGTVIEGHCHLYDDVRIGRNCLVHAHGVLGGPGTGYERDEAGGWVSLPQIGATVLEDDVEVGANAHVARGSLGETRIGRGAKIGPAACIGHNARIGEAGMVLVNAVVGGSTILGRGAWVSAGAVVRNNLVIGDGAKIAMGAVVYKDVPPGAFVAGNPGREVPRPAEDGA